MTWTVACFCGNVYSAPPDRCDACGTTLSDEAPGDTPTRGTATADVSSVLAARRNPHRRPGPSGIDVSHRPPLWRHAHIDVRSNT